MFPATSGLPCSLWDSGFGPSGVGGRDGRRGVAKESHTRMATGLAMIAVALVGAVVGVIFA